MLKKIPMSVALIAWLGVIVLGTILSATYENKPGDHGAAPTKVVSAGDVAQPKTSKAKFHMIMFVHPKCPCTRASIAELRNLMEGNSDLKATVYCYRPSSEKAGWEKSEIWKEAQKIDNVTLVVDVDGAKAGVYRIVTSGQVLLYDVNENLVFSGGITGARGHVGENVGESMIDEIVSNPDTPVAKSLSAPVFGCRILKDGTQMCTTDNRAAAAKQVSFKRN